MVVPAPGGVINPLVLAAADLAGVSEIYRVGGAQAIAALAYGTETIRPVAKIVGPGNAYVAAAKRQVFGTVGIDMIAGPSEVLVVADGDNDPDWIAADLLAQAEHDAAAQSILITDDAGLRPTRSRRPSSGSCRRLPRAETAAASWRDFGAVILVDDLFAGGAARRPHRRRACRARDRRCRRRFLAQDPQCRRGLPRPPHAGSRSATMSAAPTTCCRRRARRASRRASRCSTS